MPLGFSHENTSRTSGRDSEQSSQNTTSVSSPYHSTLSRMTTPTTVSSHQRCLNFRIDPTVLADMDLLLPDSPTLQAPPLRSVSLAAPAAAVQQSPTNSQADYPVQRYKSKLDPNQKLDSCCRKQGVSPHCQQVCNFDNFTDRSVDTNLGDPGLTSACA